MRAFAIAAVIALGLGCVTTVTGGEGGASLSSGGGGKPAAQEPADGGGGGGSAAASGGGGAAASTASASATGGDAGGLPSCPPDTCAGIAQMTCGGGGPESCTVDPVTCVCTCSCDPTPLVLVFDDAPVTYRVDAEHGFALSASASAVVDWPDARTPWLAMDLDGDGRIGDGAELFGSMTLLADGRRARDGFEALRDLDANGDGRLDAQDPAFERLLVWADLDGDRASRPDELSRACASLMWIDLRDERRPSCDARGNCEVERARFGYRDALGAEHLGWVVDVHLHAQR